MKKIILGVLVLFAVLLVFSNANAVVFKQKDLIVDKLADMEALKQLAKQKRCEKITQKAEAKREKFEKRKEAHLQAYKNLRDRLNKFAEKLTTRGYDAADLRADVVVLEQKIDNFETDYQAFLDAVAGFKNYACDKTNTESKTKAGEIRTLMATVREDSRDIRNYYKTVIKPDLLEIKKQTPVTD